MKTFKEQVEEILHDGCSIFTQCGECAECVEDLDRILSAHNAELDRIAHDLMATCEDFGVSGKAYNAIVKSIQAQKGS